MATTTQKEAGESVASSTTTTDDVDTEAEANDGPGRLPVTEILRELGRLTANASPFQAIQRCRPDGDWSREDLAVGREAWTRARPDGYTERVLIASDGVTRGWIVQYQGPDGTSETISGPCDRETAMTAAEEKMADLASVPVWNRTGRAEEELQGTPGLTDSTEVN